MRKKYEPSLSKSVATSGTRDFIRARKFPREKSRKIKTFEGVLKESENMQT